MIEFSWETLNNMQEKLNLGDISIVPSEISPIESRKQCNVNYPNGQSPFFVAPMDTVLDENNYEYFHLHGVNICLPRGIKASKEHKKTSNLIFESYSLEDFENLFCKEPQVGDDGIIHWNILIDVANGHMKRLMYAAEVAKTIWGNQLTLMVGNIANPKTVKHLCEIGVDYVRIGVGGGFVCTTTTHTGVHYPMASLIRECSKISDENGGVTKIIADGGIKSTADVNIALACGADYVMMGSLFNQCIESCSKTYWHGIPLPRNLAIRMYENGFNLYKKYRGMSTIAVQKKWGKKNIRLSEGVHKKNPVNFDLEDLLYHLQHRLRTAMSYAGKFNLNEYNDGSVELIKKTHDTNIRINK